MTRGKHAALAASRREMQDVDTERAAYQHAVARLNREVTELREALAVEHRAHLSDVRALKAQLSEGLSPELTAMRHRVEELREERDAARTETRVIKEKWSVAFTRMADYFDNGQTSTRGGAVEQLLKVIDPDGPVGRIVETPLKRRNQPGAVAIARARGELK